jgi:hypothetical protein
MMVSPGLLFELTSLLGRLDVPHERVGQLASSGSETGGRSLEVDLPIRVLLMLLARPRLEGSEGLGVVGVQDPDSARGPVQVEMKPIHEDVGAGKVLGVGGIEWGFADGRWERPSIS